MSHEEEVRKLFEESGALTRGHFILRSGLHSGHYFQCALVGQYLEKITRLAELLLPQIVSYKVDTVIAPAMGGLVFGQEVARQLGKRYIFAEKVNDRLELRRGFKIARGERVLVIEDVITRGGRVDEILAIIQAHGGIPVAVGLMVDRSEGKVQFTVPHFALMCMSFPTYPADQLPAELSAIAVTKPGS